jgi:DNA-binding protein Fis
MSNPSLIYLRLLQASFGGYISSISTKNSEYQQRWSAYVHFQLPRIFASCIDTQFDAIKQSLETFLLHNEYLLNRMDELCVENVLEQFVQTISNYTKTENSGKINELILYIQQIRQPYVQQIQEYYQNHQTRSSDFLFFS